MKTTIVAMMLILLGFYTVTALTLGGNPFMGDSGSAEVKFGFQFSNITAEVPISVLSVPHTNSSLHGGNGVSDPPANDVYSDSVNIFAHVGNFSGHASSSIAESNLGNLIRAIAIAQFATWTLGPAQVGHFGGWMAVFFVYLLYIVAVLCLLMLAAFAIRQIAGKGRSAWLISKLKKQRSPSKEEGAHSEEKTGKRIE